MLNDISSLKYFKWNKNRGFNVGIGQIIWKTSASNKVFLMNESPKTMNDSPETTYENNKTYNRAQQWTIYL